MLFRSPPILPKNPDFRPPRPTTRPPPRKSTFLTENPENPENSRKSPEIPKMPLYKHVVVNFSGIFFPKRCGKSSGKVAVQTGRPLELGEFARNFGMFTTPPKMGKNRTRGHQHKPFPTPIFELTGCRGKKPAPHTPNRVFGGGRKPRFYPPPRGGVRKPRFS